MNLCEIDGFSKIDMKILLFKLTDSHLGRPKWLSVNLKEEFSYEFWKIHQCHTNSFGLNEAKTHFYYKKMYQKLNLV